MPAAEVAGFRAGLKFIQLPVFTVMLPLLILSEPGVKCIHRQPWGRALRSYSGACDGNIPATGPCVFLPSVSIMSQRVFGQGKGRERVLVVLLCAELRAWSDV